MPKNKTDDLSRDEVVAALVDYETDLTPKDDKDHDEPLPQQSDEELE
ncbi:hypothetical protein C2759_04720 [Polynucleobacter sp. MG-Unter2-18]|nr:hypothetical protein [Polynucleobacter sp. MG-Unter2-18]QWD95425.1 hypothetical protein C2759_04720 [Polynucleobacter sp. MG-Unter2-18]